MLVESINLSVIWYRYLSLLTVLSIKIDRLNSLSTISEYYTSSKFIYNYVENYTKIINYTFDRASLCNECIFNSWLIENIGTKQIKNTCSNFVTEKIIDILNKRLPRDIKILSTHSEYNYTIFQLVERNDPSRKCFIHSNANRRPINVSLSLRITRWRPIGSGICTCTKQDDRRVRLIRNKSISRPVDCRPNDSTAIQLTVSSWLSNNARSFDEDESRRLTYTTLHKTKRDYTRSLSTSGTGYLPFTFDRWTQRIFWRGVLSRCMKLRDLKISN